MVSVLDSCLGSLFLIELLALVPGQLAALLLALGPRLLALGPGLLALGL